MSETPAQSQVGRRQFFKLAGGAAALSLGLGVTWKGKTLSPIAGSSADAAVPFDMWLGGTDGWIGLPATPAILPFHPDSYAPSPFTTYIFGFRNVTGLDAVQRTKQKNKAQHNAPLFWAKEGEEFRVRISNLGLAQRPDLFDAHTLHWHGFRNVIPFFDGEPSGSVSVPAGAEFTYVYQPREPGTYMYHCHVEDTEHVHMGMTGLVFVRPAQDGNTALYPSGKYAYNDGDGSTGFDREYSMFLSEVWAEAHWADAHIQLPEWSDYHPDFSMLNGRVYPDTIAPGAALDATRVSPMDPLKPIPFLPATRDINGELVVPPAPHEHLQFQPVSSLVECNAGEKVLLRFANLGFKEAAMTTAGIKMKVIGRDATPMKGRSATLDPGTGLYPLTGVNTSYETNTISLGAGESFDVMLDIPAFSGVGAYDTYMLYNRNYTRTANLADGGYGGQTTEIRVYPAGSRPLQTLPNT
jgi:FtsP/CotA-like multicopper oxidase with cupredoxin domain